MMCDQKTQLHEGRSPQSTRRQFLRHAVAAGIGAPVLGALSGTAFTDIRNAGAATPARKGGQVTFGAAQDVDILDPHLTSFKATRELLVNIFEPLVCYRPGDFRAYPCLAESWNISPDLRAYTFRLRKDVRFHDGTPLDAEAVKFSFERIMSPQAAKGVAQSFMGPYDRTDLVDSSTIRIRFTEPFAPFLTLAGLGALSPVSPTAVRRLGRDFGFHPVGTGPFQFKEWVQHNSVTMTRNEHYAWAPQIFSHRGPAYLDRVVWRIVIEPGTRAGLAESGEVQIVEQPSFADVERLQKNPNVTMSKDIPRGSSYCIHINVQLPPTNEMAVRKAIQYATNKEAIVKTALRGFSDPAYSPLQPTVEGYDKNLSKLYPYDPAKARSLLDGAGWRMGQDGIRTRGSRRLVVEEDVRVDGGFNEIATLLQSQLRSVGIDLRLRTVANTVWAAELAGQIPRNLLEIRWWYPDPSLMQIMFGSKAHNNGSRLSNTTLDHILATAAATPNVSRRDALYSQAQQIVMDDADVLPVAVDPTIFVLAKTVKGYSTTYLSFPLFHGVHLG